METNDNTVIRVENVSKTFRLPHEKNTSIKGAFINFYRRKKTYEEQRALQNVSLKIKQGEFYGIIGRNGGGKSTLLKMLAGIYTPTKGAVDVKGVLTPFIELGVGFNPELTGRENVYLNGALLGFNHKEMEAMYDEIVEFAELERFMDQKLKNYSSGMQVRLAFSIAIRAKSDILLIDEVLAVGDENFQKKCISVFEELKREGRTIVFVSHSMGYVKDFCDKVAVIHEGKLVFEGDTAKAIDTYNNLNLDKDISDNKKYNDSTEIEHLGTGGAKITDFKILDHTGKEKNLLKSGEKFSVEIKVNYTSNVSNPIVCMMFRKTPNEDLFSLDNYSQHVVFKSKKPGDKALVKMSATMPLGLGEYFVSVSVTDQQSSAKSTALDILNNVMKISVSSEREFWSLVKVPVEVAEQDR